MCSFLKSILFEYTTPKIVTISSAKIGLFNRFVQLSIIAYIIVYAIYYKKGYQETDTAQSAVTTKLKGIASTLNRVDLPDVYRRVWDTADFVIPAQENNAIFVMTNAIITPRQTQTVCPEDTMIGDDAFCDPSDPRSCIPGQAVQNGNGVKTGKCVNSLHPIPGKPETNYTCEIEAWCPVEFDNTAAGKGPLLYEAENFTLLIKNFVQFPKFGKTRRNILDSVNNETYLKSCHYNRDSDPYCPIFRLGDITDQSNVNFTHIAEQGGVIGIVIKWDCNLDFDIENCRPQYSFSRLDNDDVKVAVGWNFRFAKEYRENGTLSRDLFKAFGILFVFSVQGTAGKFSAVPLIINIGSGLALLGLATIFCDLIILYIVPRKMYYKEKKFLKVVDTDFTDETSTGADNQGLLE